MSTPELQEGTESGGTGWCPPPSSQGDVPPPSPVTNTHFRFCCCRWCRSRRCWGCRWVVSGRNIWGCGLGKRCEGSEVAAESGEGDFGGKNTHLRLCRWGPGPGGGCEGGGAGGAPKKARKPLAGDIICPTLPWSNLGLTEGRGLPTRPETRANWLGDIRPAWGGTEGTPSQLGQDLRGSLPMGGPGGSEGGFVPGLLQAAVLAAGG